MFLMFLQVLQEAVADIADIYRQMMLHVASRILGDEQKAEDAVQDALLQLLKNADKMDNIHSDRSRNYIYTITQNAALALLRQEKRQPETVSDDEFFIENIQGEQDIHAFVNTYGFGPDVEEALAQLSPLDRDILCYRYGAGYTPREIAKYIGESRDYVYKRMQRAEKILARSLTKGEQ